MLHPLLIALVAVLLIRESFEGLPVVVGLPGWIIAMATLAPLAAVGALTHLAFSRIGRALDRTGDGRLLGVADVLMTLSRAAVLGVFTGSVIVAGWLDAVRSLVGDPPGLDELIALLPPVGVLAWLWWAFAPIDRRVRDAGLLRRLDEGEPIDRPPTRGEFVWDHMRHSVLIVLVPILLLISWSELIETLLRLPERPSGEMTRRDLLAIGLQLAGVLAVLSAAPLMLRFMWSTRPLGPGALRDRLMDLCRAHRVRCSSILVWRSRTGMLNGAMVGVLPWLRYVLLTDALLERLSGEQVEAVMAHEVGHARRHHLPWLLASIIASVGVCWSGAELIARAMSDRGMIAGHLGAWLALGLTVAGIAAGLLVFGAVSRRFELQADAFAAQHLSGMARGRRDNAMLITEDAVRAMAGALGEVAYQNHIPPRKFTFRHGSIRGRQQALARLIGRPVHALPIDCRVRRVKLITLIGLAALIVMGAAAWS